MMQAMEAHHNPDSQKGLQEQNSSKSTNTLLEVLLPSRQKEPDTLHQKELRPVGIRQQPSKAVYQMQLDIHCHCSAVSALHVVVQHSRHDCRKALSWIIEHTTLYGEPHGAPSKGITCVHCQSRFAAAAATSRVAAPHPAAAHRSQMNSNAVERPLCLIFLAVVATWSLCAWTPVPCSRQA